MREMSTEMAALLKSGKMIGANRPTTEVVIGDGGNSYDFEDSTNVYLPHNVAAETTPSFVKLGDGTILSMYCRGGTLYQAIVNNLETLLSANETITSETAILTLKTNLGANVFKAPDGNLYFVASYTHDNGVQIAKTVIYKSALGDGSDWALYSTLNTYDWTGISSTNFASVISMKVGKPYFTSSGRWVIAYPKWYTDSGYATCANGIAISDDIGITWATTYDYTFGTVGLATPYNTRNIVKFKNNLYILYSSTYSGGAFRLMKSNDDGDTWTIAISVSITEWNDNSGRPSSTNFTTGADTNNLYVFTEGGDVFKSTIEPTAVTDFSYTGYSLGLITHGFQELISVEIDNTLIIATSGGTSDKIQIIGIGIDENTLQAKSITINRSKGMAGGLTLELDNKEAILAPDGTANPQLLWPNKEVIVKQGYGAELLKTFTGLIDSISMSRDEQGVASVTVSARDKLKVALDHLIRNQDFLYTLTYTNMLVEDIWKNLVGLAGLIYNTVEATGLTISEKTFSWETYADAFSWLDEIAGFETYCDEDGELNFVWDGRPATVTTAYSFIEGVDITRLGYEINDVDLYYTVAVYGKLPADPEVEGSQDSVIYFAKQLPQATYWNIPSGKVLRIDAPDADTLAKCEIIADKAIYLMQTRARQVTFSTIGIPHLQRGDFIQVEESSTTISEIYRITDISTQQGPDGYGMTLTCYYHAAPEVVV